MPFTKATVAKIPPNKKSVTYYDIDGSIEIRISTTTQGAAWRNNNPGNLVKGPFARRHGAIADDGHFAIFPDEETGKKAKCDLLQGKFIKYKSIRHMLKGDFDRSGNYINNSGYAPKSDGNNPDQYADQIKQRTGLDVDNKKLADFNQEEWTKLIDAMKKKEGWNVGQIIKKDPAGNILTPIATESSIAKQTQNKPTSKKLKTHSVPHQDGHNSLDKRIYGNLPD
jgi:hypothetical protein